MSQNQLKSWILQRPMFLFVALGAIFFLPGLGNVHLFDWDEINFAEAAREMILLDDYLRVHINFQPFWEKPPLFFWLQVLAMKGLGVGEYAARLPNAVCGILTLALLFRMGQQLFDTRFGIFWALSYIGSILPHLYFKSGIIDPWFNLFIFGGLSLFIMGYWKKGEKDGIALKYAPWIYFLLGGLILGLALLTKGPVAALIVGLVGLVYWISQRFRLFVSIPQGLLFWGMALVPFALWIGIETWKNGTWFITEFTQYQIRLLGTEDAGHGGFFGYHFVVLLIGCFPASILAIRSMWGKLGNGITRDFRFWMLILFWVVLILFSIVQSKIIHYSSLCYFPLTYFSALSLQRLCKGEIPWSHGLRWGLLTVGGLLVFACFIAPYLAHNLDKLEPLLQNDPSALESLKAEVHWTGWEFLPGAWMLLTLILADFLFRRSRQFQAAWLLFGGGAIFVSLALGFYVKRVEGYSQRAAIEFWKSLQGKEVHVSSFSYKSYAPYFYANTQPPGPEEKPHDINWILYREHRKDVYIGTKIHRVDRLTPHVLDAEEVGRKNGFVFFIRRGSESRVGIKEVW